MNNAFRILALPKDYTEKLKSMSDTELAEMGARRFDVDANPGFPCRASLEDAKVGEKVIAISYQHLGADSPYQSAGPIFVRENAFTAHLDINEVPNMLFARPQSLRAYNQENLMVDADLAEGEGISKKIEEMFANSDVSYIHIHNAKTGCFNCKAVRV